MEERLQLRSRVGQMMRGHLEMWTPREPMRQIRQRHENPLLGRIRFEPSPVAHPRINRAQPAGKRSRVRVHRREYPVQEIWQRLLRITVPADGEKVIEENVTDDPRVVPVIRNQNATELSDCGMRVGERIHSSMVADSLFDS